jgi:hypothetical protein
MAAQLSTMPWRLLVVAGAPRRNTDFRRADIGARHEWAGTARIGYGETHILQPSSIS